MAWLGDALAPTGDRWRILALHYDYPEQILPRLQELGIDLMEHAEFLDPDDELRFDPKITEMMAESRIWVSPTLQTWTRYSRIVALKAKRDTNSLSEVEEKELKKLEERV